MYVQKRTGTPYAIAYRFRFYKMKRLCGIMETGGRFGALAVGNVSAFTARFDWDLQLYINPNKPWRNWTASNVYRRVNEVPETLCCVCDEPNSRWCRCLEPFLQSSRVQTHTELHVGDCCSHRSKLHIHRWIATHKNAQPTPPNAAWCTR